MAIDTHTFVTQQLEVLNPEAYASLVDAFLSSCRDHGAEAGRRIGDEHHLLVPELADCFEQVHRRTSQAPARASGRILPAIIIGRARGAHFPSSNKYVPASAIA